MQRIWRSAYGEDYPAEAAPSAFYARSTLLRVIERLPLRAGETLVDLGCGNGGAGLWLAQQSGATLIGIDLSQAGLAAASARADALGLGDRAQFRHGDIAATGLPPASCDAAIALDVLCFVDDKPAALAEAARLLRPGARFAFTTWEEDGYSQRLNAAQLADYRPALTQAGFAVELYEEPADWRRQQRAVCDGLLASEAELARELGPQAAGAFMALARGMLGDMAARRYILAIARRL